MKKKIFNKKTVYYASTFFIALLVGVYGGLIDIYQTPAVIEIANNLQYPLYFFTLLGIFKILGGVILLLPRNFTKIRDIAYTGFAFDFIFAAYSHWAISDSFNKIILPIVILMILSISYYLKDKF